MAEDAYSQNALFHIRTRRGLRIPVYGPPQPWPQLSPEFQAAQVAALEKTLTRASRRRRDADPSYNCHGLTLAGKLGWVGCISVGEPDRRLVLPSVRNSTIDGPTADRHVGALLQDRCSLVARLARCGPAPHLGFPNQIELGDIAVYRSYHPQRDDWEVTHSELVVKVDISSGGQVDNFWVLSKFAHAGEYIHPFRCVPDVYGDRVEIWTDRGDQGA